MGGVGEFLPACLVEQVEEEGLRVHLEGQVERVGLLEPPVAEGVGRPEHQEEQVLPGNQEEAVLPGSQEQEVLHRVWCQGELVHSSVQT